jgi:Ca2+:H+ antiporter
VYILYLLFQLKSHSYIYESTPQYKIDEESHPGVLADILNSSSSSESSDDNDTDASSGSNTTVKRIRNALRKKRRRKSSSASKETASVRSPSFVRTGSSGSQALEDGSTNISAIVPISPRGEPEAERDQFSIVAGSSAVVSSRDFENDRLPSPVKKSKRKSSRRWKHAKHLKFKGYRDESSDEDVPPPQIAVDPAPQLEAPSAAESQRRSFNLRNLPYKPAISRVLSTNVFTPAQTLQVPNMTTASGSQRPDLRRTSSLPDRLDSKAIDKKPITAVIPSAQPLPHLVSKKSVEHKEDSDEKPKLSRSAALILLLVTTGLVAACAEFLVDSIDYLVSTTGVSQAFIGLIILPIVGNAAEHVTAVTVASKNKMDLAIGVALGSSIQIALFVTPVIVLLGWILDREMSLYFSLFETVSLFVSAFIVNYLMLDGRSNYLEGALLIAAYVIIAVAAFFYPSCDNTSTANGGPLNGSCR